MSKKVVKQFMDLGDKINCKIIKGSLSNPIGEFELIVTGEFKDMSNSTTTLKSLEKLVKDLALTVNNGFEKVNSRLDNIETRLDVVEKDVKDIKTRLDVVETDIKDIKSCPTIQQELKNKK